MKSAKCDRCGGSLLFQQELGGRCVRCLLELGVLENTQGLEAEDPSNAAGHLNVGTCVGRYRILRLIGEGGMGVVYEAEQEQPRRHVALKLIRPGITGKATLRRFERETQALGRLQHPGIAQIYDAGTADAGFGPQPFFAMELIRGITPGEYAKQHRLSVRERLELVAKVAEAVHHAHQRGIIHRDLKPSNILVDETGQPKVLDFGVSRAMDDSAPRTRQTEMGQLLGTVAYMSPEQVMGDPHEIDVRTDIYALGVILYELLADRPPYEVEGSLQEALTAVREAEPTPLGTLVRDYRGDIETIAAKALEKDKNRRYTSAAELAADIQRFLSEEPIIARPPTATYQLKKFARRHKVLVTAAGVVTVALLLGVIVSSWQARRALLAEQAALVDRGRALQAEAMATEQRNLALDAQRQAIAAEQAASAERDRANVERDRANVERDRAQTAEEQARRDAKVANTQRLVAITQYLVREALGPETARDDYDLASALIVQAQRFSSRISAEPRQAVEDALQRAMLWNPLRHNFVSGGNITYRTVAFSPDGVWLAAGGADEMVRVWNMRRPAEAPRLLDARGTQTHGINVVTFSNNGNLLAVGSHRVGLRVEDAIRIWDLENPRDQPLVLKGPESIDSLSFSPDGRYLTSVSSGAFSSPTEPTLTVWDLRNSSAPRVLSRDRFPWGSQFGGSGRVSYSPDGSRLASAFADSVKLWDLENPGAAPFSLRLPETTPPTSSAFSMHSVAFSPDGIHLATSSSRGVHVWNLRNLQAAPVALTGRAALQIRLLAYNRDGSRLAGVSSVSGISIWDLRNVTAPASTYQTNGGATGMAFSLDGTRVAAATKVGVQVWNLSPVAESLEVSVPFPRDPPVPFPTYDLGRTLVYSSDLRYAVEATNDSPQLWDLRAAVPVAETLEGHRMPRRFSGSRPLDHKIVFCRYSTRVALSTGGLDGTRLSVWDLGAGGIKPLLITSLNLLPQSRVIACSPDGNRLALTERNGGQGQLRIIDHTGFWGHFVIKPLSSFSGVTAVFSSDGNTLAVGIEQAVYLWNVRDSKRPVRVLPIPWPGRPTILAFSPDGSRLVAGTANSSSAQTALWDLRNPHSVAQQLSPSQALAFSHDGSRLATIGDSIRIWDLANPGTPSVKVQWNGIARATIAVAFTADDLMLKAGDEDGRVAQWRLWSAAADSLCERVWRNLSMSEWKAHVGEDIPYERTCPNLPPGVGAPAGPK